MGAHWEKRDRTARLLRIQVLLGQNPDGLDIEEIASKCEVSIRTVYRDLDALDSELHVPIWAKGNKRGVVEGYHLPPIPFTIPEAMNIALAARLMQSNSRWYDPHRASTLMKLNSVIPPPLRKQVQNIIDWLEKQPRNPKLIEVTEKLADSWISQHQVVIKYQESEEAESKELTIEPYFIEPATPGNSGFVIAYSHSNKTVSKFKISCINHVKSGTEPYSIPPDFNVMKYLSPTWGLSDTAPGQIIKLRFKPQLSRPIREGLWSPLLSIDIQKDGYSIITLRANLTTDFCSWVLGWGDEIEVLEPETFRNSIIQIIESTRSIYNPKNR
jgi:predicted DNA-binding transcriptional regulator YafY